MSEKAKLSDSDLIEWLNHWLATFHWHSDDRLCHLEFKDPYGHLYEATGKDLRECVGNAVTEHPSSLTFIKGGPDSARDAGAGR